MKTLCLVLAIGVLAVNVHAQTDPLVRMLEGYLFEQAVAELIPIGSYVWKHADSLNLTDEQKQAVMELDSKLLRTYMTQWVMLEHRRDVYVAQGEILSRQQNWDMNILRYIEQPQFQLLIAPSVQREFQFTEEQKEAIKILYMTMRQELASVEVSDNETTTSIHASAAEKMLAVLTEAQLLRLDARKAQAIRRFTKTAPMRQD